MNAFIANALFGAPQMGSMRWDEVLTLTVFGLGMFLITFLAMWAEMPNISPSKEE